MPRYFSAPRPVRADDDDGWFPAPMIPDIHVPEHHPVDTGLVDSRGNTIMRAPYPIGFGRDDEW